MLTMAAGTGGTKWKKIATGYKAMFLKDLTASKTICLVAAKLLFFRVVRTSSIVLWEPFRETGVRQERSAIGV